MGIEAQRKKYLFFFFVCFPFTFLEKDHAIYCPEPLWNMTSLDLIGDSLRSGRGSLTVQPPRAALDSTCKWPGRLLDIFTGPWVELGRWMICQGMDLFLNFHWWKRDDPTTAMSVALSREQMENLGCIWLFSMLPQNFLGSPISLPFCSSLVEGSRGCHLVTTADISYISLERTKNCPLVWFQQHSHKLIMIIYNEHNECNLQRAPKTDASLIVEISKNKKIMLALGP